MKNYIVAKNMKEVAELLGISEVQTIRSRMRVDLVMGIQRTIERQKLTHLQAATQAKVGRTVITAIMNANIERISTDRLLDIADRLNVKLKFRVA